MTDKNPVKKAVLRKPAHLSLAWVVPLLALIITVMLLWHNTINKGPEITLTASEASGIEAGKTLVKFRSVSVGKVTAVKLADNYRGVELQVSMDPGTEALLNQDSVFYVVKPRVQSANISGLDTILSGNYIQLYKGNAHEQASEFELHDELPADFSDADMRLITLISTGRKKLNVSDPVTFKGFEVGRIVNARLDEHKGQVVYKVGLDRKYLDLFNANTVFWVNSGMDFSFGPSGINFNTDALQNLISGGITFDDFGKPSKAELKAGTTLQLHDDRTSAASAALKRKPHYVVMIKGNLENLAAGSMVKLRGVEAGRVLQVPWYADGGELLGANRPIPALIALSVNGASDQEISDFVDKGLKNHTLCASVGSSSLISKGDLITLEIKGAKGKCQAPKIAQYRGTAVIPTAESSSFTDQLSELSRKLNEIDYAGISKDVRKTLQGIDKLLATLDSKSSELDVSGLSENLEKTLKELDKTLSTLRGGADGVPGLLDTLEQVLTELDKTVKEVRPGLKRTSRDPSLVIFGGSGADPIPAGEQHE